MVICEHVSLSYGASRDVLKDVNFKLEPGSFHFLTGASGAGKSSLLGLLSLSLKTVRGKIMMFGKDVSRLDHESLPYYRRKIGMIYQDFRLLDHLNVEENIGLPLKVVGLPHSIVKERVKEMLEWVGLSDYRKARPEILSGGQKQRVAIARAVIGKPEILLADEPSGNLDTDLSYRFMYLFEALGKLGTTIVVATHDEHLISQYQYPVLRLNNGKLLKS